MKYLSLDIETTDIIPSKGQILQIGCVVADTNGEIIDTFEVSIIPDKGRIKGNLLALYMNIDLLADLSNKGNELKVGINPGNKYAIGVENAIIMLGRFCCKHFPDDQKIPVAGKNVGTFDIPWLEYHRGSYELPIFSRRYLDVGSMFVEHYDKELPNLQQCMERAGVEGEVTHNALKDALDVVSCITNYFNTKETFNKAVPGL